MSCEIARGEHPLNVIEIVFKLGSFTHSIDINQLLLSKEGMIMSPRSKKKYLQAIYRRYKNSCHIEKSSILDEFCLVCGYNRRYAIRLLNGLPPQKTKKQATEAYSPL